MENTFMVRLMPDYGDPYRAPSATSGHAFWMGSDDERTFVATDSHAATPSGHVTLIVANDDPRSRGMWDFSDDGPYAGHKGWHVSNVYVIRLDDDTQSASEEPVEAPLTFGDLAVGELWQSAGSANDGPWIKLPDSRYAKVGNPSIGSTMHDGYAVKRYELPTPVDEDAIRRDQRDKDLAEFDAWKERATETAHQYANNNSLCGEFDRCMEDIGLSPRQSEYQVEIRATYYVTVTARDGDDAVELAYELVDYSHPDNTETFDVERA